MGLPFAGTRRSGSGALSIMPRYKVLSRVDTADQALLMFWDEKTNRRFLVEAPSSLEVKAGYFADMTVQKSARCSVSFFKPETTAVRRRFSRARSGMSAGPRAAPGRPAAPVAKLSGEAVLDARNVPLSVSLMPAKQVAAAAAAMFA